MANENAAESMLEAKINGTNEIYQWPTSTWENGVTLWPHQEKQHYDVWHHQEKENLQNQE